MSKYVAEYETANKLKQLKTKKANNQIADKENK